mmetsp:Transcript_49004/g.123273  ORF Transcript_49004/g.123273 Transcript_49004/m.123273 type:complete len:232 (+) Transcript_49004:1583-2278(+)
MTSAAATTCSKYAGRSCPAAVLRCSSTSAGAVLATATGAKWRRLMYLGQLPNVDVICAWNTNTSSGRSPLAPMPVVCAAAPSPGMRSTVTTTLSNLLRRRLCSITPTPAMRKGSRGAPSGPRHCSPAAKQACKRCRHSRTGTPGGIRAVTRTVSTFPGTGWMKPADPSPLSNDVHGRPFSSTVVTLMKGSCVRKSVIQSGAPTSYKLRAVDGGKSRAACAAFSPECQSLGG